MERGHSTRHRTQSTEEGSFGIEELDVYIAQLIMRPELPYPPPLPAPHPFSGQAHSFDKELNCFRDQTTHLLAAAARRHAPGEIRHTAAQSSSEVRKRITSVRAGKPSPG